MERYNYELISSGGLRPPQHQVEYKSSSLLIIEFVSLIAAEAGDLRYYINLLHYNNRLLLALLFPVSLFDDNFHSLASTLYDVDTLLRLVKVFALQVVVYSLVVGNSVEGVDGCSAVVVEADTEHLGTS